MKSPRKLTEPQLVVLRAAVGGGDLFTALAAYSQLTGRTFTKRSARATISSLTRRGLLSPAAPTFPHRTVTDLGRAVLAVTGNGGEPAGDGLSITGEMPALTPAPGAKS